MVRSFTAEDRVRAADRVFADLPETMPGRGDVARSRGFSSFIRYDGGTSKGTRWFGIASTCSCRGTRSRIIFLARIIVAEDDELVSEILQDALIRAGYGVGVLADGNDALRVIRARKPDIVILDCNLPGLSGVLILQELRKDGETCDIPALMLTGRRSDADVSLAMFAGADDYMKKPFDPEEVVFRVDELLAKKAGGGAHRRTSA
jgi:CheY-like chemotaxis protein